MISQTEERCLAIDGGAPRRLRRGYTLIEILVAVMVVAMLMSGVAVVLQTMYRVDRQLKNNIAYGQVLPRLSLQLRTDVHAARDAAVVDGPNDKGGILLTMATTGEVIEYHSTAGQIVRTWQRDGKKLGHEVYYLGQTTTFRWQITQLPSPLVELEIVRAMGRIDSADSRQVDRVVAAIGIRVSGESEAVAESQGHNQSELTLGRASSLSDQPTVGARHLTLPTKQLLAMLP